MEAVSRVASAAQQIMPLDFSYGSWLCKNAATRKRGRTNVRPNHR